MNSDIHWADVAAAEIIKEHGMKEKYICASRITPSGHIHIGNFREVITTALVVKALERGGKKVQFVFSWDDFDRFRKVPIDLPKELEKHIGMPISDVPDPFKCHSSYAEHFEKEFEEGIKALHIKFKIIQQSKRYRNCAYSKEVKRAFLKKDVICGILNKYRKKPLDERWWPITVYCEKCNKDFTRVLNYDNKYSISYECDCGYSNRIDFRKKGIVKPVWRVDWPMSQNFEKVDFEPGGKDHYAAGGSRITANEIIEAVWNRKHVTDLIYEWIGVKGGKQFSSSAGVIVTPKDVLEIYEPEVLKYLFVGTKPYSEFAISFDLDVIKIYEDFDRCERIYFGKEKLPNKKEEKKQKRIYELSCIKVPKKMPNRIGFRHLTTLLQIHEGNIDNVIKDKKNKIRARCAWTWLQKYAPEEMKFKVHKKISNEIKKVLSKEQKKSLRLLKERLIGKYDQKTLFGEFYKICDEINIKNTEFFKGAYLALIGKEKGPKLAPFILTLGKSRVTKLFSEIA